MTQNHFILHGHFYQPPRENPWTGFIDRQISSSPFPDWNTRIHHECYAACASSPVLEQNKFAAFVNCYAYLSFNFGPTLLQWMDSNTPETVKKIVEADKLSQARLFGHGNAIAQVFNHMIMPLANKKDQYTQIIWGLADFKRRFGRDSEGIWLGETAINNETAAILVDCGIKFVILSPFQAQSVIENNNEYSVEGGHIETGRAYTLNTKKGALAVFFYDGLMASGISFGNLLQDTAYLEGSVKAAFASKNTSIKLVHTATDGEAYGHHKKSGNMTLARFIYNNIDTPNPAFLFTNYGAFLAEHPPAAECTLISGVEGRGTSWSCAHGVGRWYEDCGCHTGGLDSWNQRWRTSLRDAFDYLCTEIHNTTEKKLSPYLKDVWTARNDYYTPYTLNTLEAYNDFFHKHAKKHLSDEEKNIVLSLMGGLRFAMFMYTSCGWFFSDISGIETIQDLLYAQRAYEYFSPYLEKNVYEHYCSILAEAKSNITTQGSGLNILVRSIEDTRIPPETLRIFLVWLHNIGITLTETHYTIEEIENNTKYCIIAFHSAEEQTVYGIYAPKGDDVVLYYKEFSKIPKKGSCLDNEVQSWGTIHITSLPSFLYLHFVSRLFLALKNRYGDTKAASCLHPDLLLKQEKNLLPEEKDWTSMYLYHWLTSFASSLNTSVTLKEASDFRHMISCFRKFSNNNKIRLTNISILIASRLPRLLENAVKNKDTSLMKNIRLIVWEIKEYADDALSNLRDMTYHFHLKGVGSVPYDTAYRAFHNEFSYMMDDLRFFKAGN